MPGTAELLQAGKTAYYRTAIQAELERLSFDTTKGLGRLALLADVSGFQLMTVLALAWLHKDTAFNLDQLWPNGSQC